MGVSFEKGVVVVGGGGKLLPGLLHGTVVPTLLTLIVLVGLPILIGTHRTNSISNLFMPATHPSLPTSVPKTEQPWISTSLEPNYTASLLRSWLSPSNGAPCREKHTTNISIAVLDDGIKKLTVGDIHELAVTALDETGTPRCLGGDYFETDLSGESWKSRPPVKDHGNGSYTFSLQVHHEFAGVYNLTVVLLFRRFEGLKFSPVKFAFRKQVRRIQLVFYKVDDGDKKLPELRQCGSDSDDFLRETWSGRWTRQEHKERCPIRKDGRYRCLPKNHPCRKPWCHGPVGSLESNGWVYSAHCSFRIFTDEEAWSCLNGRWLFFWGDSNHVDTIRNLLNFVLGLEISSVPRRFDTNFTNPKKNTETVRITSIFNGHWNDSLNYQGLDSLRNKGFRDLVRSYFNGGATAPDTVILNSGLHDGVHWRSVRGFIKAADYAALFWEDVLRRVRRPPAVFYRTTIATGGYARDLAFNPSKMEIFNNIMVEKLNGKGLLGGSGGGVVDGFDMTFPWHFDNRCNDGVHYGRAPAKAKWTDGEVGHQYFVDLMLGHVLLNAICGVKETH